uniref:WAP domain-containing protein n=1 Tax=Caenorhabditis japonica TaxID=281687 RepID=A0A8R1DL03_CAEJA
MRFLFFVFLTISICLACTNFDKYLKLFCQYGAESSPCTVENYNAFKTACCSLPGSCSFSEFPKDNVCCFTKECLARCFPGKKYQLGSVY